MSLRFCKALEGSNKKEGSLLGSTWHYRVLHSVMLFSLRFAPDPSRVSEFRV